MSWRLVEADCVEAMAAMPDASVDAIVCDPPYHLRFMGRAWDHAPTAAESQAMHERWAREALRVLKPGGYLLAFGGSRTYHRLVCAVEDAGFEIRDTIMWLYGSGFPKSLDVSKAIDKAVGAEGSWRQEDHPGRPGERKRDGSNIGQTNHATTDANPDGLRHIYEAASDDARDWQGWGTALKPAHEPIVVARKPLSGTVAQNIVSHRIGGLNIDGCRITSEGGEGIGREEGARGCPVHGLRGLRHADAEVAQSGSSGEVASGVQSEGDDGGRESALDGRDLGGRSQRLSPSTDGLPAARGPGATSDTAAARGGGTSLGDGAAARPVADGARVRPPRQRRQVGQPAGESNPDGLGDAQPRAQGGATSACDSDGGESGAARCTCGANGRVGEASAERRYTTRGASDFAATPGRGGDAAGRWPANVVLDEGAGAMLDEQSGPRIGSASAAPGNERGEPASRVPFVPGRITSTYDDSGGASRFFYCAKAASAERNSAGRNSHPTVKPVALMRWLVRLVTPPGGLVLDPFAGSGTTGIAAVLEGAEFVGVERDGEYVRIAEARIAFAERDPGAFVPGERARRTAKRAREWPTAEQIGLLDPLDPEDDPEEAVAS